jgi:hypothetical protein
MRSGAGGGKRKGEDTHAELPMGSESGRYEPASGCCWKYRACTCVLPDLRIRMRPPFKTALRGGGGSLTGGVWPPTVPIHSFRLALFLSFLWKYSLKYNNYLCSKSIRRFSKQQANYYEIAVGTAEKNATELLTFSCSFLFYGKWIEARI